MSLEHPKAAWLLHYFGLETTTHLPRLVDLAALHDPPTHLSNIDLELRWMVQQRMIERVTGSRSLHRGHAAVRVMATGKVLKTVDCPLTIPEHWT